MQGRWVVGGVAVLAMSVASVGCDSDERSEPRPNPRRFDPIGTVTAPTRPFTTGKLPTGWRLSSRTSGGLAVPFASTEQVLFMPVGSTPTSGPALLVGYVTDEEWSPESCDPPRVRPDRSAVGGPDGIIRWGKQYSLKPVAGPSYVTSNGAYVFGRDVDSADLLRAASSVQWPESAGLPSRARGRELPRLDLPPGFVLRATGELAAHEQPWPVNIRLEAEPKRWISIGQEQGNAASVYLAEFWRSVTRGQVCGGRFVDQTLLRGHTIIRIRGFDTPADRRAMAVIARGLHRASPRPSFGPGSVTR